MTLKSTTPLRKTISGKFDKRYESLRYTAPRPIPTNDNLDLTKEEDFLHPEEPKPQDYLTTKVKSKGLNSGISEYLWIITTMLYG